MSKPKKSFSAQMGGNSASAEIAKFETGDGGVGVDIVHIDGRVEPKKASAPAVEPVEAFKPLEPSPPVMPPAKEKQERPAREAAPSVISPVMGVPLSALMPRYDFRKLPEPEKTLRRVEAVLSDSRFSHGERAAAALLALAFMGGPDTQTISVKKLLSDSRGFSAKVRNSFLAHATEAELITASFVRGVGSEITLLF